MSDDNSMSLVDAAIRNAQEHARQARAAQLKILLAPISLKTLCRPTI